MESTGSTNHSNQAQLIAESMKQLFQQPFLVFISAVLMAATLTAYLFRNNVGTIEIIVWLTGMYLIVIFRIILIQAYRRMAPPPEKAPLWGFAYLISVSINGAIWGIPALYLSANDLVLIFFYTLVISGIIAGSIPMLSYHLPIYSSFALFSTTPYTIQLFRFETDFYGALGVFTVLFVLTNIISARNTQQKIHARIKLEFENRELIRSLFLAKEDAENSNLVKTKFLAAASHDLRQPLHALDLFVDLLDARIQFPEVRKIVDNIKLSTQSLKGLLNSLLDISKLDAGVLKPEFSRFTLQTLLDQLELEYGPQAANKGLKLRIRSCNAWVNSDSIMLARILRNILSNAIRYTRSGGVLLGCRKRQGSIRIEVYDTGQGIPAGELDHIFTEFYQVDNHEHDRNKGLGLGLAIVKRLADLMQHPIEVRSREGNGSVFSVTVPAATAIPQHEVQTQIYRDDLAGAIILVIDDEAAIREGMGEVLQDWGCHAVLADSADHALQQLENNHLTPDIIIADYQLREGKTGVQAIKQISASLECNFPAVVVTGDIAPERLYEAQTNGYHLLHKPVSAASLRSLTSYILEKSAGRGKS